MIGMEDSRTSHTLELRELGGYVRMPVLCTYMHVYIHMYIHLCVDVWIYGTIYICISTCNWYSSSQDRKRHVGAWLWLAASGWPWPVVASFMAGCGCLRLDLHCWALAPAGLLGAATGLKLHGLRDPKRGSSVECQQNANR